MREMQERREHGDRGYHVGQDGRVFRLDELMC